MRIIYAVTILIAAIILCMSNKNSGKKVTRSPISGQFVVPKMHGSINREMGNVNITRGGVYQVIAPRNIDMKKLPPPPPPPPKK